MTGPPVRPSVAFEAQPYLGRRLEDQERVLFGLERTFGGDAPRVAVGRARMGALLRAAGRLDAARVVGLSAYEKLVVTLGEDHPQTLAAANELGLTLLAAGRLEEAESLLVAVYNRHLHRHGATAAAPAAVNLALALRARGDLEGALNLLNSAVAEARQGRGDHDAVTVGAETNLASLLAVYGQRDSAVDLLQTVRNRSADELGESHTATLGLEATLGAAYRESGDIHAARETLGRVYSTIEPILGPDHPSTLGVAADLAVTLGQSQDPRDGARAIELGRHVLNVRTQQLGRRHPQTVHAMRYLARAAADHDDDLALEVADEAARVAEQTLGRAHPDTLHAVDELATTLERRGNTASAERMRARNAEILEAEPAFLTAETPAVENLAGVVAAPDPFTEGDFTAVPITAPPPDPKTEVITRTAHALLDPAREIRAGELFRVRVFLDTSGLGQGPGHGAVVIDAPLAAESLVLDVWLVATRHFEITGAPVMQLEVRRIEDVSEPVVFELRVTEAPDAFPEDPQVRVRFSYNGWPSGEVQLPVPLTSEQPEMTTA